jgi:hypothetical protein
MAEGYKASCLSNKSKQQTEMKTRMDGGNKMGRGGLKYKRDPMHDRDAPELTFFKLLV